MSDKVSNLGQAPSIDSDDIIYLVQNSSGTYTSYKIPLSVLITFLEDYHYTESEIDTLLSAKAATSHNHDSEYYTETEIDSTLANYILASTKGAANGVAELDSGGKVPAAQLPASVAGALNYQGSWNANTNSPALATGVGTLGYYYTVSVAGATTIDGENDWAAGDMIAYNGTAWEKIDNTEPGVDDSTIELSSGNLRVKDAGITLEKLENDAKACPVTIHFPGAFATDLTADDDMMENVKGFKWYWEGPAATLISSEDRVGTADSGASGPQYDIQLGSNDAITDKTATETRSAATVGGSNIVANGDQIQIRLTNLGTNGDAEDLCIDLVFRITS